MKTRRVVFILVIFVVIISVGVGFVRASPRVLRLSPEPDTQSVPGGSPLSLTFSKPMKPGSVEEHLIIDPSTPGSFRWEGNTLLFMPDVSWLSGETINVRLESGSQADGLLPLALLGSREWSFTIGRPLIAYLWPAGGTADLYALEPLSGEVIQLTSNPFGILDFDINADGTVIYYSARNPAGGSDIFAYDRLSDDPQGDPIPLLACPDAFCRSPRGSPDDIMLAYERNPLPGSGESLFPQVWIRSLNESPLSADILAGDPDNPTRLPNWSSEGVLSFYDVVGNAFILLDPFTEDTISIPNDTGEVGSWSPDRHAFVAPEIIFTPVENQQGSDTTIAPSHLFRFDLPTTTSQDLSVSLNLEDTYPVYSPNGNYLAFARKSLDPALWTPGRQLWVMRPDGREAHELTTAPYFNHSSFAWSPDNLQIAYLRFNQDNPTAPPEIWLMKIDGSSSIQLVIGGYAPQWIP